MQVIINADGHVVNFYREGKDIPPGSTVVDVPQILEERIRIGISYVYSRSSQRWTITDLGTTALNRENWRRVRIRRDALLVCTDFTQLPDVTLDHATWAVYRQALRDVTSQPDPTAITWPVPPDASIIKNVPPMEVL
jgi:hypothetical protein